MTQQRIKLVVAEEHTLGYIDPSCPQHLCILHASILKGSPYSNLSGSIMLPKNHRLANAQDFENFNQYAGGFLNPCEYEYDTSVQIAIEPAKCDIVLGY